MPEAPSRAPFEFPAPADPLPGVAGEIEELIGTDLALKLIAERGGTELYIPAAAEGSALAGIVGDDAAASLIAHFGRVPITLPCGHLRGARGRRERAKVMLRAGASLPEVALACGVHVRTVTAYRRQMRLDAADTSTDP